MDVTDFIEKIHSAAAEKEPVLRGGRISADNLWTLPGQAEVMDAWHDAMVEKLLLLQKD